MPVLLCFEITYPVSNELVRDIGEAKTLNTVPKETGNWIVPLPFPHCLHTTDSDNPNRGIVPSYIVCFSTLDAHRTRGCPLVAYRIRIDGTAQRQCKIMPDIPVRCKRMYPLLNSG